MKITNHYETNRLKMKFFEFNWQVVIFDFKLWKKVRYWNRIGQRFLSTVTC